MIASPNPTGHDRPQRSANQGLVRTNGSKRKTTPCSKWKRAAISSLSEGRGAQIAAVPLPERVYDPRSNGPRSSSVHTTHRATEGGAHGGGGAAPTHIVHNMLRALLASLLLTALYARALTGAERRTPVRARAKRPPSSSAGAKTRTRYVDDPGFVGDGYFEAVEVHRREPPRAARTPALDFGNSTRPVYVADPLWL